MKRWAAGVQRTGQPTCMQREEMARMPLYWSSGSVSIAGLRFRTYRRVLPDSPEPSWTVTTLVT